ncbi:MAG TPA: YbjN domain-containing protein [Thermoleophilaceae bacterium]|nr:YbjN domain-containing protein [Thermoleophilaceae bacterium]
MPSQRIIEQVHGILAREDVRFILGEDRSSFLVPVPHGSAAVLIDFHAWGRRQTMISLAADVLVDVEVTAENRLQLLEHLNALNQTSLFGRFFLDADRATIVLRYDLLGDELESSELINALYSVGVLADQADDELQRQLGTGRRAADLTPSERPAIDFADTAGDPWRDVRPTLP